MTSPPTPRQQRLLRELAHELGHSFTAPTTRAEASSTLDRMLARKKALRYEQRRQASRLRRGGNI
jgi:hypothetical protein